MRRYARQILAITLSALLVAGLLWASAPATIPTPSVPSQARLAISVMSNGVFGGKGSGKFVQEPYLEIVMRGCVPITDAKGQPVLTQYGTPAYTDTGWIGDLKIPVSSLSATEIQTLMPTWKQDQTVLYGIFQSHAPQVTWHQQADPPAAQ